MRLINADALIDDLKHDVDLDQDSLDYEELTDSNREIIQFDKDCKQNAIDLLQNAPTIETERKKGKWIEDAETYYKAVNEKGGGVNENTPYFTDDIACSECLAKFSVIDNEAERFDFCPNCGADMRGEKNETD